MGLRCVPVKTCTLLMSTNSASNFGQVPGAPIAINALTEARLGQPISVPNEQEETFVRVDVSGHCAAIKPAFEVENLLPETIHIVLRSSDSGSDAPPAMEIQPGGTGGMMTCLTGPSGSEPFDCLFLRAVSDGGCSFGAKLLTGFQHSSSEPDRESEILLLHVRVMLSHLFACASAASDAKSVTIRNKGAKFGCRCC